MCKKIQYSRQDLVNIDKQSDQNLINKLKKKVTQPGKPNYFLYFTQMTDFSDKYPPRCNHWDLHLSVNLYAFKRMGSKLERKQTFFGTYFDV